MVGIVSRAWATYHSRSALPERGRSHVGALPVWGAASERIPLAQSQRKGKKRRTREHVLEELSFNYLERFVLALGHQLARPEKREYGHDATMFYYSQTGEKEKGEVRFQLKGTDRLHLLEDGRTASFRVETAHLLDWVDQVYPFVLVVYDATREIAYWLHMQPYLTKNRRLLDPERKTRTIHLPTSNVVDSVAIETLRELGLGKAGLLLKLYRHYLQKRGEVSDDT
jgi:hypothetical protein